MRRLLVVLSVAALSMGGAVSVGAAPPIQWPQWGQDPQHTGAV